MTSSSHHQYIQFQNPFKARKKIICYVMAFLDLFVTNLGLKGSQTVIFLLSSSVGQEQTSQRFREQGVEVKGPWIYFFISHLQTNFFLIKVDRLRCIDHREYNSSLFSSSGELHHSPAQLLIYICLFESDSFRTTCL